MHLNVYMIKRAYTVKLRFIGTLGRLFQLKNFINAMWIVLIGKVFFESFQHIDHLINNANCRESQKDS